MADEGQARAGKGMADVLGDGDGVEDVLSRQKRMLLQQYSRAAPQIGSAAADDDTRLWGKNGDGGESGREGVEVGGDDHLRCRCARQVRRGGTEVTPTPTLNPPVPTGSSKSWTTVRCGAVRCSLVQALEQSPSKQGTWACQNEGLGT